MSDHLHVWIEAFSGLGLFLFGMLYLEAQIKASAGRTFKRLVQHATGTRFKSLLTGLAATAFFQSSSVVTLMALSLVGAELMPLQSAIAVIFGANVGTTVTAWLIALIGFKMDIKLLSYVMIGLGGLGSVLAGDGSRYRSYFGVMVGFGLIFLGLKGMQESFGTFSVSFDLSAYAGTSPYWFALIGLVLTALIQSSSASVAIAQSAIYTHIIGFEAAAAFVIGANVGTTVTAILGAIGGIPDKKRMALAHLVFNLSTGAAALMLLGPLVHLTDLIGDGADGVVRIAVFHTLFNVLGVLIWYPFIAPLQRWLKRFFHKEPLHVTQYIRNVSTEVPDLALDALEKEIGHLSSRVETFALLAVNIPPPKALEKETGIDKLLERNTKNFDIDYDKLYRNIRLLEGEIYRYIARLSARSDDEAQQETLGRLQRNVSYLATAAKSVKDMLYDLDVLHDAEAPELQAFYKNLRYQILKSVLAYHDLQNGKKDAVRELEETYARVADSYRNSIRVIETVANDPAIASELTSMAINALHLVKSFSKSLRNIANLDSAPTASDDEEGVEPAAQQE